MIIRKLKMRITCWKTLREPVFNYSWCCSAFELGMVLGSQKELIPNQGFLTLIIIFKDSKHEDVQDPWGTFLIQTKQLQNPKLPNLDMFTVTDS